jgi:hypothetical protein
MTARMVCGLMEYREKKDNLNKENIINNEANSKVSDSNNCSTKVGSTQVIDFAVKRLINNENTTNSVSQQNPSRMKYPTIKYDTNSNNLDKLTEDILKDINYQQSSKHFQFRFKRQRQYSY